MKHRTVYTLSWYVCFEAFHNVHPCVSNHQFFGLELDFLWLKVELGMLNGILGILLGSRITPSQVKINLVQWEGVQLVHRSNLFLSLMVRSRQATEKLKTCFRLCRFRKRILFIPETLTRIVMIQFYGKGSFAPSVYSYVFGLLSFWRLKIKEQKPIVFKTSTCFWNFICVVCHKSETKGNNLLMTSFFLFWVQFECDKVDSFELGWRWFDHLIFENLAPS